MTQEGWYAIKQNNQQVLYFAFFLPDLIETFFLILIIL